MAAPTNTRLSYNVSDGDLSAIGIREDLSGLISNISPMETPFVSSIGKSSALCSSGRQIHSQHPQAEHLATEASRVTT